MIILCDVDCVVADLMTEWLRLYNNDYSDCLTPENITAWGMEDFVHPHCGTKIYSYLTLPTLYDNVKPIGGSLEFVQLVRSFNHRVVFVSAGLMSQQKFDWLSSWGFEPGKNAEDFITAYDKSLIRGSYLIDDRPENVQRFREMLILFRQPWNDKF